MADIPEGSFTHTLEQIDAATTQVENAKGNAASLAAAITAAAESVVSGLDVTEVGGSGKYISAIKEENGIIVPTVENIATAPASGGTAAISSGAVFSALEPIRAEMPINRLWFTLEWIKSENVVGTWTGDAYERDGITFEPHADGSVYVHGTADANNDAWLKLASPSTTDNYSGMYMKGCPSGGSSTTYSLSYNTSQGNNVDYGNATTITKTEAGTVWIAVRKGTTIDATFYPMIYSPTFRGAGFVQGAPSNRQLLEMILDLQNSENRSVSTQLQSTPPDDGGEDDEER